MLEGGNPENVQSKLVMLVKRGRTPSLRFPRTLLAVASSSTMTSRGLMKSSGSSKAESVGKVAAQDAVLSE